MAVKKSDRSTMTQRKRISKELIRIAPETTPIDHKAAIKQFKISKTTIYSYLKGEILNIDLGLDLLIFYSGRIKARELKLVEICQPR